MSVGPRAIFLASTIPSWVKKYNFKCHLVCVHDSHDFISTLVVCLFSPPAYNSLHNTGPEEEPPLSLPGTHVQRCSSGAAAFSPQGSHRVRNFCWIFQRVHQQQLSCLGGIFVLVTFGQRPSSLLFPNSLFQLFSRVWLPHLRSRGSDLLCWRSPKQLLDRAGDEPGEAGAAAEIWRRQQGHQQRTYCQRWPVEEGLTLLLRIKTNNTTLYTLSSLAY